MKNKKVKKPNIMEILRQHFEEDKKNFDKIGELLKINGEHMSHFNKSLLEVKEILRKQNISFSEHRNRIEPMLSSYERNVEFNKELSEKVSIWGKRFTWAAAVIAALVYIRLFIIKILQ